MAGLSVFSICIVVSIQIFTRMNGTSVAWTEELTRYIFIWMIFLGVSIGFREAESPRVTFLQKYFPSFFKRVFVWVYSIGSIGFFLFMIISGIQFVFQQLMTSETSSVLQMPVWVVGLIIPFAALTGVINVIQSLLYKRDLIEKGG